MTRYDIKIIIGQGIYLLKLSLDALNNFSCFNYLTLLNFLFEFMKFDIL